MAAATFVFPSGATVQTNAPAGIEVEWEGSEGGSEEYEEGETLAVPGRKGGMGADFAEEYCRYGLSVAGMVDLHERYRGEITESTTTSDVCHAIVKPATVPAGWVDEVSPLDGRHAVFSLLCLDSDRAFGNLDSQNLVDT